MTETYRARQRREARELADLPVKLAAEKTRADKAEAAATAAAKTIASLRKELAAEKTRADKAEKAAAAAGGTA